ncbi:aminoglycoside phosphotransferase family protein [Dactylosporangium aurantiacum]|uniref:Aminoglycoside phosphotransferase family protein n=1 Tax=Dactylosporangium aurantiacum TaxID=35754 RepID=A0A9Q9MHY9_9ACTN|nr:aminoglycoside phosphotransferase family protein [Dactylosporangium aurantiacum]MDG6109953.1 aminoglycoside phosphotransferase family protein [Dactylosporangium aurantiacum]UWZ57294.1 aminoglycoside phosphotransferase family protein [Dactylosporangium aurantiacum]
MMRDGDAPTSVELVRRLVAGQFPQWTDRPVAPVGTPGTDNAMYRLGDDLVVRLPRRAGGVAQIERDRRWLPLLAPRLPLPVPAPVAVGGPAHGYPFPWTVGRWLPGSTGEAFRDRRAALDLAGFVTALRAVDPTGAPRGYRGGALAERDPAVRAAIEQLHGELDTAAATRLWQAALAAPAWEGPPVWSHGDLHAGNVLADGGRVSGVIDFGCAGVGDPACDVMPAWTLLGAEHRGTFRDAVGADDAMWARARGWVLCMGLVALPYYRERDPAFAGLARRMLNEALLDETMLDETMRDETLLDETMRDETMRDEAKLDEALGD